jgi:putative YhdH/YhfP family quinone oxidoreductase
MTSHFDLPEQFTCYYVEKDSSGKAQARVTQRPMKELPPGELLIRVAYSSLNRKDAMSATGHPGVTKAYPHVPGVDVVGVVADSGVYEWVAGDPVLATGFDIGANHWGGFAQYVQIPQDWALRPPQGLSARQCMMLGTAGLTAGLCIDALQKHAVAPDDGPVVVSGASGGVGSIAVAILARLGYRVSAVSGKPDFHATLKSLGAAEVLARDAVSEPPEKSLLARHWAGGVDAVGGNTLSTILRATKERGCVAACGVTGGAELPLTVYPFILRGVTLAGIDASLCPLWLRDEIWNRLGRDWKPEDLEKLATTTDLDGLPRHIDRMLTGQMTGRVVVDLGGEEVMAQAGG